MFVGKAGAYLSEVPYRYSTLTLGWKSLPGTNALAYYKKA
jgi:hypothetical protein